MTKSFFSRPESLLPPRGGRVELLEIRPLRPNQDVILPGMVLKGHRVRFTHRDCSNYRSRAGYAQCDGITQFSGPKGCKHQKSQHQMHQQQQRLHQLRFDDEDDDDYGFRLMGNLGREAYSADVAADGLGRRNRFDRSRYVAADVVVDAPSSAGAAGGGRRWRDFGKSNGSAIGDFPPRRPTSLDAKRRLDEARLVSAMRNVTSQRDWLQGGRSNYYSRLLHPRHPKRVHAFGTTFYGHEDGADRDSPPKVRYQNYVYVSDDEDNNTDRSGGKAAVVRRGGEGPSAASSSATANGGGAQLFSYTGDQIVRLLEREVSSRPTSRASLISSYNFLFERHIDRLARLEAADGSGRSAVGENGNGDDGALEEKGEEEEDRRVDALGSELVRKSLEEVTEEMAKKLTTREKKAVTFDDVNEDEKEEAPAKEEGDGDENQNHGGGAEEEEEGDKASSPS